MEILVALGRSLFEFTLAYGVVGLAAGAFLESLGIPTAAVVIDLTAGLLIISNRTSFLEAVIVADAGLVVGSLVSFYLGRAGSHLVHRLDNSRPATATRQSAAHKIRRQGCFLRSTLRTGPDLDILSGRSAQDGCQEIRLIYRPGGALYCTIVITVSLVLTDMVRGQLNRIAIFGYSPLWFVALLLVPATVLIGYRLMTRRSRTSDTTPE